MPPTAWHDYCQESMGEVHLSCCAVEHSQLLQVSMSASEPSNPGYFLKERKHNPKNVAVIKKGFEEGGGEHIQHERHLNIHCKDIGCYKQLTSILLVDLPWKVNRLKYGH